MNVEAAARMRADWNQRATEDAHYYVAFGRREQTEAEFFETGAEIVSSLEAELFRLSPGNPRARRALEIGCGPGRLMKPMSRHFGEIHGVDVSDAMVQLARQRLAQIPWAHTHATNGSELCQFADSSFDFIYSYAVFQHIPEREVVFSYLNEIQRVLRPSGVARLQLNGLPRTAKVYDTWAGVRVAASEVEDFARANGLQLLALEGADTQYMWTTWMKPPAPGARGNTRIRRITNAHSSEPVAPNRGRFASISIWIEDLDPAVDLLDLSVRIGNVPARATYIGPPRRDGVRQLTAVLTGDVRTGLLPVDLVWRGELLCPAGRLRVIPAGPEVPRIVSVTDGVNLMSGTRIETGTVKVTIEDISHPEAFGAVVDGVPLTGKDVFCTDPLPRQYEINFVVPGEVAAGPHLLEMQLGHRHFAPVAIDVQPANGPL